MGCQKPPRPFEGTDRDAAPSIFRYCHHTTPNLGRVRGSCKLIHGREYAVEDKNTENTEKTL